MLKDIFIPDDLKSRIQKDQSSNLNMGYDRISIEESKTTRYFKSYKHMIKSLKKELTKLSISQSANFDTNTSTKIKLNTDDIYHVICEHCDVAVKRFGSFDDIVFIENPDTKLMTSNTKFFEKIITDICKTSSNDIYSFKIDDISKFTKLVVLRLSRDSSIRDFVDSSKSLFIMKNNVVIDIKSRQAMSIDDVRLHYDITSKSNVNFIFEQTNESLINQQIITRVMKDWSSHDEEVEYLLWQIIFAVAQGQNHNKFIVIKGPGGNGKSTFMQLLSKIAGESGTKYVNIHQFGDPNSINDLDMKTRVMIGDDAATNHKISDVALSNLKSIVTGDPISLPMKYSHNVVVQTNALFIQGTNTDLSFYENNPATKSRMIKIDWSTIDFRSEKPLDITFNLDELMNKQSFIDEWMRMTLQKVEYFEDFSIPESVKRSTEEMIEENDTIKQFLDDIFYKIDGFKEIPIKTLFLLYEKWKKVTNPNSGSMKLQTFTKQLKSKESEYGFVMSDASNRKSFNDKKYMIALSNALELNVDQLDCGRQAFLSINNSITDKELEDFANQQHPISDISDRQQQMIHLLIHVKHRTDLISLYY